MGRLTNEICPFLHHRRPFHKKITTCVSRVDLHRKLTHFWSEPLGLDQG